MMASQIAPAAMFSTSPIQTRRIASPFPALGFPYLITPAGDIRVER
ncbi:MAG: hypothetical protein JXB30_15750 [Anaerolineae bacterium]|nr:hypothetical protein [Anaerolineae bacterium]